MDLNGKPETKNSRTNISYLRTYGNQDFNNVVFFTRENNSNQDLILTSLESKLNETMKRLNKKDIKYQKLKEHSEKLNLDLLENEQRTKEILNQNNVLKEELNFAIKSNEELNSLLSENQKKFIKIQDLNNKLNSELNHLKNDEKKLKNELANTFIFQKKQDLIIHSEMKKLNEEFENKKIQLNEELIKKENQLNINFEEKIKDYKEKMRDIENEIKQSHLNEISDLNKEIENLRIINLASTLEINKLKFKLDEEKQEYEEKIKLQLQETQKQKKIINENNKNYRKIEFEKSEFETKFQEEINQLLEKVNSLNLTNHELDDEMKNKEKILLEKDQQIYKLTEYIKELQLKITDLEETIGKKNVLLENLERNNLDIINETNQKLNEMKIFQMETNHENTKNLQIIKDELDDQLENEKIRLSKENIKLKEKNEFLNQVIEENNKEINFLNSQRKSLEYEKNKRKKSFINKIAQLELKHKIETDKLNLTINLNLKDFEFQKLNYEQKIAKLKNKLRKLNDQNENFHNLKKQIMNRTECRSDLLIQSDREIPYSRSLSILKEINNKISNI